MINRMIFLMVIFVFAAVCRVASAAPFTVSGWQIHKNDEAHINRMIDLAAKHGVNHMQLSHDIIMYIEDITKDPARAAVINRAAQRARQKGIGIFVWSHEFNTDDMLVCLDPDSKQGRAFWKKRQDAYRKALAQTPDIAGIILSFGSSHPDPWSLMCSCSWCAKHDNADRVSLILNKIGDVVIDEFGMTLYARTFIHTPEELDWMGQALRNTPPRPGLAVMTKCVPQDWEPFYPHNPLIGNVGGHPQIIEMDLAGEYWGRSKLLVDLTDYLQYRMRHARDKGAAGFVVRTERGADSLLGAPNEINLFAYEKLFDNPDADADEIRLEFIKSHYGLDPESQDAKALLEIHKLSFDVTMKMYYVLGFWALEKGSDLTESATFPALLRGRSIALYDPSFEQRYQKLDNIDEDTFLKIMFEKQEAAMQSSANLDALEAIGSLKTEHARALRTVLENHERATRVWLVANGALWSAYMYKKTGQDKHREWALDFADYLDRYAEQLPAAQYPGGPAQIAAFLSNFHKELPGAPATPDMDWPPWHKFYDPVFIHE
jgi:hypothetical protein